MQIKRKRKKEKDFTVLESIIKKKKRRNYMKIGHVGQRSVWAKLRTLWKKMKQEQGRNDDQYVKRIGYIIDRWRRKELNTKEKEQRRIIIR